MKSKPTPSVSEATPWQKLDRAFRTVLTVPKKELLREEAKQKKLRAKKRAKQKKG